MTETWSTMKTTVFAKQSDVVKKWVLIDVAGKPLGRVASTVASIIRGKTKPIYTPHVDTGDNVIIINAAKVKLTGKKWDNKIYHHHTGWPGGIKSVTAKQVLERQPSDLLKKAIQGMLPKTKLGRTLHNNFRIYNNDQHPHTSQNPEVTAL